MSTHVLVGLFDDQINGVLTASGTPPMSTITGNYVIRVPDDIPVRNPTSVADLITKKYAGTLGMHALFTQIIYDDMLDGLGMNAGASNGITLGDRGTCGLYPVNGAVIPILQTAPYGIVWGGTPPGPAQAIVTYELFEYVDVDDKGLVYVRKYREVTPDTNVSVQVSFNGGTTFFAATDKALVSIPLVSRGTSVVLKFTRTTSIATKGRVLIGSWAVLF